MLEAQVARYAGVEYEERNGKVSCPVTPNVKDLDTFTRVHRNVDFAAHIVLNDKDEEVFNFGKHKGQSVKADVPLFDVANLHFIQRVGGLLTITGNEGNRSARFEQFQHILHLLYLQT